MQVQWLKRDFKHGSQRLSLVATFRSLLDDEDIQTTLLPFCRPNLHLNFLNVT